MKIVRPAFAPLFALCASMLLAQTPAPTKEPPQASPAPLIVDVHSSPYRSAIYYSMNIGQQRYDMRDATILDMIEFAYNREGDAIIGGPSWIDFDRFDVVARVDSLKPPSQTAGPPDPANPPPDPYDLVRPVLKQVLADRFHLTYHTEDRPLPGYVVTVAKSGSKLTVAKDPTAIGNCQGSQDKATPGQYLITCTSETMANFLTSWGGVFPHPAVDHTGLTKSYDFTFTLVFGQLRTRDDYVRLYADAFSKQLGLAVTPADVPQPAIVIDKLDRPTPNPPEIAKLIPAMPDLEFEVATIRPAADTEPLRQIRPTGSQITFTNFSLQELLTRAWQFPTGAMLGNRPPWLTVTKYTILVKLPPDIDGRVVYQNQDQLDNMLQKLLIDRFQIKYHWGEQTQDGYVLLAGTPKMKKADPNSRSTCDWGAPQGEKDMNAADSPFDVQFHCQNVTMGQFADVLQSFVKDDIKNHVQDKTGLTGDYDFTVYYTSLPKLRADALAATAAQQPGAAAAAPEAGAASSEPTAGMTSVDALRKELGLRLEKQPVTSPALILDHIEQTPTEN